MTAAELPDVQAEDAAEAEDGAQLLDDVRRFAGQYLVFDTAHHLVVLCLWIAHTWSLGAFYVTPRLILDSPEPGSGKTRVLEVLALLCRSAKLTLSTTTAALYRRIAAAGDTPPTILQDEADAVFGGKASTPQAEELRALYNSGYKRGATVDRCEGDSRKITVREFPVFAAVALAGLAGRMPATITDRAVTLHMRRRAPGDVVAEFRERDAAAEAQPLRRRMERWADHHRGGLTEARPAMPDGVRDRAAEVWEALLAVADAAGGDWPQLARDACRHFVLAAAADERLSLGVRLLRDVRDAMGGSQRMFSANLVEALTTDPESEWRDLRGRPLDQLRLANELKRYGVNSKQVRIGVESRKGYDVAGDDGLSQAWNRYLPAGDAGNTRNSRNTADQSVSGVSSQPDDRYGRNTGETAELPSELLIRETVSDVSAVSHINGMPTTAPSADNQRRPTVCPECRRAAARADTGLCDFCTGKRRASKEGAA